MKKSIILSLSAVLMATVSCSKTAEGNKSIIKENTEYSEDLKKDSSSVRDNSMDVQPIEKQEYTERYVGDDKTSALVTFKNTDKENTISIRSNNKTISAPQKEAWAKGGVYENFDITIVAKNDSITITQEDKVIYLKKARQN